MIIGLHDSEKEHFKKAKTFPNYALMKISAYHKAKGDTVEWWDPVKTYDRAKHSLNLPTVTYTAICTGKKHGKSI